MAEQQNDSRGEARQSFFARQQLIEQSRAAFQQLAALLRNQNLYPASHPIMLTAADKLRGTLADLLIGRKDASYYIVGGELFFDKISIPIDQALSLLVEHFTAREIGGISFRPGLTSDECIRFAELINRDPSFFAGSQAVLITGREGIKNIDLHRVLMVDKDLGGAIKAGKQKASEIFRDTVDTVKEMVQAVQLGKGSSMRKMNTVVQHMVDNILDNRDAFLGLTNIKMYDEYTFAHSVNVSILAVSLGTFLSLEKRQIAALGLAGLMHDIGKMRVPIEVINKPGKLTDQEWEAVKRHPIEGALLLASTPGISKLAMVAAFEHHQHGPTGYPSIDGALRQHPFSQIVALADSYDAITAARVYYTNQTPPDQAIKILLYKRGTFFNPVLVNAFVRMVGIFPIGTIVRLTTGETGIVVHQTNNLMRPHVLILTRFDGSEKQDGVTVSLLETSSGQYQRSVAGTIEPVAAGIDVKQYIE